MGVEIRNEEKEKTVDIAPGFTISEHKIIGNK